ncbi:hypothetical protein PROFUN_01789 [Planoprotostelium fungivorum]|uniref:Uncharacterized protein n=1 Tax=Planoprotostelium fungivorum TaxID=1890364 RepID=A0A2P6MWL6_9EUKA|nr:hypothetical protein PROFUN_01789 [Planoprotostelium fungivorum]
MDPRQSRDVLLQISSEVRNPEMRSPETLPPIGELIWNGYSTALTVDTESHLSRLINRSMSVGVLFARVAVVEFLTLQRIVCVIELEITALIVETTHPEPTVFVCGSLARFQLWFNPKEKLSRRSVGGIRFFSISRYHSHGMNVTSGNWTMTGGDVEVRLTISQQDPDAASWNRDKGESLITHNHGQPHIISDGSENARVCVGGCGTQLVVVLCLCRFFAVIRSERSLYFLVEAWSGPLSTKQLLRPLECSSGLSLFRRHHLCVVAALNGAFVVETIFFLWPSGGRCLWWILCFWWVLVEVLRRMWRYQSEPLWNYHQWILNKIFLRSRVFLIDQLLVLCRLGELVQDFIDIYVGCRGSRRCASNIQES